MKNLSWLYYKGYYNEFEYWHNIKPSDESTRELINDFFKKQNDIFTKAVFSGFKKVVVPNQKNVNTSFQLKTTYPGLLMGTGYTHGIGAIGEFKIGFHLDYVTGLPIIPGSSVKGLLRSAFPIIEKDKKTGNLVFAGKSDGEKEKERTKARWLSALFGKINEPDFLSQTIQPEEIDVENKIEYFFQLIAEIFEGIKDITKENPEEKYFSISLNPQESYQQNEAKYCV